MEEGVNVELNLKKEARDVSVGKMCWINVLYHEFCNRNKVGFCTGAELSKLYNNLVWY